MGVFVSTIPIGLVGLSEAGPLKFVQVCPLSLGPETTNPNPEIISLNPNPEKTSLNPNPEIISLNPNPEIISLNPNPEKISRFTHVLCPFDPDPEAASIAVDLLNRPKP